MMNVIDSPPFTAIVPHGQRHHAWDRRDLLLVLAAMLLFMLPGIARLNRPIDSHESLVSVTARNMRASGDWVVPRFQDEPRLRKTPLAYWAVALAGILHGGEAPEFGIDESSARWPSLVASAMTVMLIYILGRRMFGRRAGAMAAMFAATSLGLARFGISARPDAIMTLFVTASMTCFWFGLTAPERRNQVGWLLAAWASLGVANMTKELVPLVIVLLPMAAFLVMAMIRRRQWLPLQRMLPLTGPMVCLVVLLPWLGVVIWRCPVYFDVIWHEVVIHTSGGAGHSEGSPGPWYYLVNIVMVCMPWVLLLPGALALPFLKDKQDSAAPPAPASAARWFAWLWLVAAIIFFTFSYAKRQHYLQPAMPAAFLLLGCIGEDVLFIHRWFSRRVASLVLLSTAAVPALGAVAILAVREFPEFLARWPGKLSTTVQSMPQWLWFSAAATAGCVAAGFWFAWSQFGRGRPGLAVAAAAIASAAAITVFATTESQCEPRGIVKLAEQVNQAVPPDVPLYLAGNYNDALVHYVTRDLPQLSRSGAGERLLEHYVQSSRPFAVLVRTDKPQLQAISRLELIARFRWIDDGQGDKAIEIEVRGNEAAGRVLRAADRSGLTVRPTASATRPQQDSQSPDRN